MKKDPPSAQFPDMRMRRLRAVPALRDLVRETSVTLDDLIYPVFVEEDINDFISIPQMPGISRIPEKKLPEEVKRVAAAGIRAVLLFGISHHKDATGSDTWDPKGLLARMIRSAKKAAPDLIVIADICFCEYTDHGHCGIVKNGRVDNDATIKNLAKQTLNAARAGADIIAPSAMMDGQVCAIRTALDAADFEEMPIMAYSTKFASALYGPFRAAAGTLLKGDRKSYQLDSMNAREALRESLMDEAEGADILMVKPALPYLDVISNLRKRTLLPLAAYQVSGEYAMIRSAAAAGALDEKKVVRETLGAIKRAGADCIITYFAMDIAKEGF